MNGEKKDGPSSKVETNSRETNWRAYSKSLIVELKEKLADRRARTLALLAESGDLASFKELDTESDGLEDTSTNLTVNHDAPDMTNVSEHEQNELMSLSENSSLAESVCSELKSQDIESQHPLQKQKCVTYRIRNDSPSTVTSASCESIASEDDGSKSIENGTTFLTIGGKNAHDECGNCMSGTEGLDYACVNNQLLDKESATDAKTSLPTYTNTINSLKQQLTSTHHDDELINLHNTRISSPDSSNYARDHTLSHKEPGRIRSDTSLKTPSLALSHLEAYSAVTGILVTSACLQVQTRSIFLSMNDISSNLTSNAERTPCQQNNFSHTLATPEWEEKEDDAMLSAAEHSSRTVENRDETDGGAGRNEDVDTNIKNIGGMSTTENDVSGDTAYVIVEEEITRPDVSIVFDMDTGNNDHICQVALANSDMESTQWDELPPWDDLVIEGLPLECKSMVGEILQILRNTSQVRDDLNMDILITLEDHYTYCGSLNQAQENISCNSGYTDEVDLKLKSARPCPKNKRSASACEPSNMPVEQTQTLQQCLDKARLVSTLQGKLGCMRTMTENRATELAYKKSISEFERAMTQYFEMYCSSATSSLSVCPTQQSERQTQENAGAGMHSRSALQQNTEFYSSVQRSDTFVVTSPRKRRSPDSAVLQQSPVLTADRSRPKKGGPSTNKNIPCTLAKQRPPLQSSPTFIRSPKTKKETNKWCGAGGGSSQWAHFKTRNNSHIPSEDSTDCLGSNKSPDHFESCNDSDSSDSVSEAKETNNQKYTSSMLARLLDYDSMEEECTQRETSDQVGILEKTEMKICDTSLAMGTAKNQDIVTHSEECYVPTQQNGTDNSDDFAKKSENKSDEPVAALRNVQSADDCNGDTGEQQYNYESDFDSESDGGEEQPDKDLRKKEGDHDTLKVPFPEEILHGSTIINTPSGLDGDNNDKCAGKEKFDIKITRKDLLSLTQIDVTCISDASLDKSSQTVEDGPGSPQSTLRYASSTQSHSLGLTTAEASNVDVQKPERCTSPNDKPSHDKWNNFGKRVSFQDKDIHMTGNENVENDLHAETTNQISPTNRKKWKIHGLTSEKSPHIPGPSRLGIFAARADWSSSDEDAVDNVQRDISPSNILKQRQKEEVDVKLKTLTQCVRRKRKSRSPLRRRCFNDTPSNGTDSRHLHICNTSNTDGLESELPKSREHDKRDVFHDSVHLTNPYLPSGNPLYFKIEEETETAVFMSASELLQVRLEEEKNILPKPETENNDGSCEKEPVSPTATYSYDRPDGHSSDDKVPSRKHTENCVQAIIEEILSETSPQKCTDPNSSRSSTSDEYSLPVSQSNSCKSDGYLRANRSKYVCNSSPEQRESRGSASMPEVAKCSTENLSSQGKAFSDNKATGRNSFQEEEPCLIIDCSQVLSSGQDNLVNQTTNLKLADENLSSPKNTAIEHKVRQVKVEEPSIIKYPYPIYFAAVREVNRTTMVHFQDSHEDTLIENSARPTYQTDVDQTNVDQRNGEKHPITAYEDHPTCKNSHANSDAVGIDVITKDVHRNGRNILQPSVLTGTAHDSRKERERCKEMIKPSPLDKELCSFFGAQDGWDRVSDFENDDSDVTRSPQTRIMRCNGTGKWEFIGDVLDFQKFSDSVPNCDSMKYIYKVINPGFKVSPSSTKNYSSERCVPLSMDCIRFVRRKCRRRQKVHSKYSTLPIKVQNVLGNKETYVSYPYEQRMHHDVTTQAEHQTLAALSDKVERLEKMLMYSRTETAHHGRHECCSNFPIAEVSQQDSLCYGEDQQCLMNPEHAATHTHTCCRHSLHRSGCFSHICDCPHRYYRDNEVQSRRHFDHQHPRSILSSHAESILRTQHNQLDRLTTPLMLSKSSQTSEDSRHCSNAGPATQERVNTGTQYENMTLKEDATLKRLGSVEKTLQELHQDIQDLKASNQRFNQAAINSLTEKISESEKCSSSILGLHRNEFQALQTSVMGGFRCVQDSISEFRRESSEALRHRLEINERILAEATNQLKQSIQENVLPLQESLTLQKKDINEIMTCVEKTRSSLEDRGPARVNKGMDHDTMKMRIVELTSQRDAEKVFHKITRESLRALERDHDRLRQEFIRATYRRQPHGDSDVRKRLLYFLSDKDKGHHGGDDNVSDKAVQGTKNRSTQCNGAEASQTGSGMTNTPRAQRHIYKSSVRDSLTPLRNDDIIRLDKRSSAESFLDVSNIHTTKRSMNDMILTKGRLVSSQNLLNLEFHNEDSKSADGVGTKFLDPGRHSGKKHKSSRSLALAECMGHETSRDAVIKSEDVFSEKTSQYRFEEKFCGSDLKMGQDGSAAKDVTSALECTSKDLDQALPMKRRSSDRQDQTPHDQLSDSSKSSDTPRPLRDGTQKQLSVSPVIDDDILDLSNSALSKTSDSLSDTN